MQTSTEVQALWDARYEESAGLLWGTDPNVHVAEEVEGLRPAHALDLGAGDGRNAAWLVEHGWRVTAVDISPVALARLRERTFGQGHDVVTIHADLRRWRPSAGIADLVVVCFTHLPQPHRGALHRAAATALREGGTLVLVAHDRANLERGVGGPQDPALLPTSDEVRGELPGLELTRCEVVPRSVEGEGQPALDLVVVGRRPVGA